ncbi:hypothetical protein [Streptomyces sp. MMBL 11-1]|uniref:hypothetical protein n=1 Tax=Streptomyces sp. MMBL 11-1 TaxID=3026420 RepID=UPI0023616722|nr:hypothetical protein [Streptomyces sp. MMBL 11-1]
MLGLDFGEAVLIDPHDLHLVVKTVLDDPDGEHPPAVAAALETARQDEPMTAEQLWHLTNFADPASVYELSLSEPDTSLKDPRLTAHIRVWAALHEQAPRTTAALALITRTDTELAITAARYRPDSPPTP